MLSSFFVKNIVFFIVYQFLALMKISAIVLINKYQINIDNKLKKIYISVNIIGKPALNKKKTKLQINVINFVSLLFVQKNILV